MQSGYNMKTNEDFKLAWPELMDNIPCGFYCPKGWSSLVWDLMQNIELELNGDMSRLTISQVKEKFGGLRFYYSVSGDRDTYDAIGTWVAAAERVSVLTCVTCGTQKGVTTKGPGWISTKCDPCRSKPK